MWHQIPLLHVLTMEQPRYTNREYAQLREMLEQLRTEVLATQIERDRLRRELEAAVIGNAKLIHALDCAIIWGEMLFAHLPQGTVLPEGTSAAMGALKRALQEVRK